VASRTPGTCGGRLWLLPSGPDQVHHHAMRGGPPLFVAVRAYTRTHYICERRLCGKRCCAHDEMARPRVDASPRMISQRGYNRADLYLPSGRDCV